MRRLKVSSRGLYEVVVVVVDLPMGAGGIECGGVRRGIMPRRLGLARGHVSRCGGVACVANYCASPWAWSNYSRLSL
jgi:hypothetical protein